MRARLAEQTMAGVGTADIVVGVLASIGVVALIVVFIWVLWERMLK